MKNVNKIVVFDLDETLGYFVEFGMFWEAFTNYLTYLNKNKNININNNLTQDQFNDLFDLYPEFCRPDIIKILEYLKEQKEKCICNKIMIYTNNQGPREWVEYIKKYFEKKINYKLFDQIIGAFKINGKAIEICRTSHLKNHKDLVRCSKIPIHTHICFLDDVFYPKMSNNNVYYINIKPYIYDLSFDTLIIRFLNNKISESYNIINKVEFKDYILSFMQNYQYLFVRKKHEEYNFDKELSKQILNHLHIFFTKPFSSNTRKTNIKKGKNKTKKQYKLRV